MSETGHPSPEVAHLRIANDRLYERALRAEAERDLLLKDAERYRWLKSTDRYWVEIQHIPDGAVLFNGQGQLLDAAIDAAREVKP